MSKKKSSKSTKKPKVNPKLEGFDVKVDRFGEIKSTFEIDKLNTFLDDEVVDKKLVNRKDRKKRPPKK